MKVFVTGGTGYLGRAIVRRLVAAGHAPVVFGRTAPESGLPGALVRGDILDVDAVARALDGCDAVVHAAAHVSIWERDPAIFTRVNVDALSALIAAAERLAIPRIVYTSSFLALPPTGATTTIVANDYQRTKVRARALACEAIERGAPLACVYPGVIYGPGPMSQGNLIGRLLHDLRRGRLAGLVGAERIWSFAFVDDVAAGHVAVLERAAMGTHWILGGENVTQRTPFDIAAARYRRRPARRIPYGVATLLGWAEEAKARLTGMAPLVTRGAVEIFRHDWALDSRDAVAALGYTITPLRDGLERTLASLESA
ncbi:MAG: NAD-dependent epimerase/dehydratase family protein [Vicinamibacterales bacterium]